MASTFDICIHGAGIVGRTLALHLAAKRLRVALVSAAPADDGLRPADVRAYALSPASRALLEAVRCWPAAPHATPVLHMHIDGDARAQVQFAAAQQGVQALNWIVDVPALEQQLAQAVQFQPLISVVDHPVPALLDVVCEGRASTTRAALGVDFHSHPYDQWAVAARVESALPHQQTARQWFAQGEITALLPLGGPDAHLHALVWSVPPARAQHLLHTTEDTFAHALQAASQDQLGALRLCSPRAGWPLHHAVAQRWVGSSRPGHAWVLAGDAAHSVHPLAGQGLNLGLGDVAELVRILDTRGYWRALHDMRLLRQYERARKTAFALLGEGGDTLHQLFSHPHALVHTARTWGLRGFERCPPLKRWVAQQALGS